MPWLSSLKRLMQPSTEDVSEATTRRLPVTSAARRQEWLLLGGLLLLALIIRLLFAPNPGFFYDLNAFVKWGYTFDYHPREIYTLVPSANYPPLAIYICWFGVKAMDILNPVLHLPVVYNSFLSTDLPILEKLPAIAADLVCIAAFFFIARHFLSLWWSLGLAAAYAFSPAVILLSGPWGQMDGIFALFLVLAWWYAIEHQPVPAGICFALALLMKPQPVILTPVLAIFLIHVGWRAFGKATLALVATGIIVCFPYLLPPNIQVLVLLHNITTSVTPYTTSYAYNLWWALHKETTKSAAPFLGPLSAATFGWLLFFAILAVVCFVIWRKPTPITLIVGGAVVAYAFFDFTIGQHERYLFPVLPLLLLASIWQRRYLIWYGFATVMCYLNMYSIVIRRYANHSRLNHFIVGHSWVTQDFSWVNILGLLLLLALFLKDQLPSLRQSSPASTPAVTEIETQLLPSTRR